MLRLRTMVGAVALLVMATAGHAQTDLWIGDFPDDNASSGTNWAGGSVPSTIAAGTDTLLWSDEAAQELVADTVMSFNRITLAQVEDPGSTFVLSGSSPVTVGSGGITLSSVFDGGSPALTITAPLTLTGTQTWTGGNVTVNSLLQGTGQLELAGGSTYTFNNGSSTYTGGISLEGYADVILGASGHPLGYGSIVMADGAGMFINAGATISLASSVQIGDGSTGAATSFGAYNQDNTVFSKLTITGSANLVPSGDGPSQTISLTNNSALVFAGAVNGLDSQVLALNTSGGNSSTPALTVFQGAINNIQDLDLAGQNSVIFDGSSALQLTSSALTEVTTNTSRTDIYTGSYVGFGAHYAGSVTSAINQLLPTVTAQNNFTGALGLDTTSGAAATFADNLDLTDFTSPHFIGLGSATTAILSGSYTPPNWSAENGGTYLFGGGGGKLTVTSNLPDGLENSSNLTVLPGNAPLTLILSGLTDAAYSGATQVEGGVLILNSRFNSYSIAVGEASSTYGYVGSTAASFFTDAVAQSFIDIFDPGSRGVVGFDTLSSPRTLATNLSLANYPGLYLGTATNVTFTGTITPDTSDQTYKFAGVKGGAVTVASALTGERSLEIGLPSPIESFGSVSSVTLTNTGNDFTGGITLNSGYLLVAPGALPSNGQLDITGPSDDGTGTIVGVQPSGGNVTIANNMEVPFEGAHFNAATSPYTLTLSGVISDTEYDGKVIVDGPVVISNLGNTYSGGTVVNGTTLLDSGSLGYGGLTANSGSAVTVSAPYAYLETVDLIGSSLTFSATDNNNLSITDLIMESGSTLTLGAGDTLYVYGLESDLQNAGNAISLGAGATLAFEFNSDPDFHGVISGATGNLEVQGGTLNLEGANTYGGTTMIDGGALLIASNSSALGTSAVTVNGTLAVNTGVTLTNSLTLTDGATLAGYGTFSPGGTVVIQNGSTVIPGSANLGASNLVLPAPGALTFGGGTSLTLGPSGNYLFAVTDANGGAGVGYSTLNVAGTLNITATAELPFTIYLYSFAANNNTVGANPVSDFNSSSAYSWNLATAGSGLITGFSASAFTINTSNFLNSLGTGSFSVVQEDNQLLLNFTPVPEPSTYALLAAGAGVAGLWGWRRRRAKA